MLRPPPEIRVLHLAMIVRFQFLKNGGRHDVQLRKQPAPHFSSGSTNGSSAQFGVLAVELVQPVSKLGGILYRVPFDVDSFIVSPTEIVSFDQWIAENMVSLYEVRVALDSGLLSVRGEASASATFKGTPAERKKHNQDLSEKRGVAVYDRLKSKKVPISSPRLIEAKGDSGGKPGEEDPNLRRCDIGLPGDQLTRTVQQLWRENRYLNR